MSRGYGQFCPLSKAAEVFAERWTPLVIRELCPGSRQFNEIHNGVPLMSRSLRAQRLREHAAAGVVEITAKAQDRGSEYRLTTAGLAFCPSVDQLSDWGASWFRGRVRLDDCDPNPLIWAIRGMSSRVRVWRLWWSVGERGEIDVGRYDPGFVAQVAIAAETRAMTPVSMGYERLLDLRERPCVKPARFAELARRLAAA